MDWLKHLFIDESVARTIILLGVAGGAGIAIGKIKICNIGLGAAGVLFAGLALGHFKLTFDHHVLEFVREFGLILFVYTLGLQIGPGFFTSLRSRGLILNLFAAANVLLGVAVAAAWIITGLVDVPAGVGLLSGATTNTPSLAAAGQALGEVGAPGDATAIQGLAYAIAYPFGIIGIIVTMILIRVWFRVDVKKEVADAEAAHLPAMPPPTTRNFEVRNNNLSGRKLGEVPGLAGSGVVVSRFSRGGVVEVARHDTRLQMGDILHAVGPAEGLESLRIVIGDEAGVDLKTIPGTVTNQRVIVTKAAVFGKPLAGLSTFARHHVVVTRVQRQGLEFTPSPGFKLQFGDVLMVVGEPAHIEGVAADLGNSRKALDLPQPMPFFFGIALGVIFGSIPVFIPGLPAAVKLGLAGGPLVVAILLSRMTTTGPLIWHMPHNANHMLREIGITLFLAAVGIKSGEKFVSVLLGADGLRWMLYGAVITIVPLLTVAVIARLWKKVNYAELCGMLAGSMTDPPALAFAHQSTASDAPGVAYATVYPLTMLLRIFTGQLLVFLLYRAATGG
ncbi:putative transporter [Opitutaceae bacterium TAV4]|uniref:putative transporter n=1 Tax=Geminisphaera colitermitum TaxID=1148786 RepID=UPI000158D4E3|nr:putative transporter [Geminisphaera colitermitum]RRJ97373.1 putative transporter [Opitutaceae bacterium TAV4]RRK01766.1 putative transporter [Opitutaceae bacterium TAV3]